MLNKEDLSLVPTLYPWPVFLTFDVIIEDPPNIQQQEIVQKKKFPSINISSQNCLSLNISTKNNKTDLKILALTKSYHEIVLLCDIRLNSLKQSAAIHDLEKKFKLKGYDFIHNSKGSSRGVGILIKSCKSYVVHSKNMDYHDNYMLLDISLDNYRFVIGSIYGPNRDELEFFDNLKLDLRNLNPNSNPVVLGGDWRIGMPRGIPIPFRPILM